MASPTPLTTVFTPPAACFAQLYWSYDGALQLGGGTECLPSGPAPTRSASFSPGLYCPESWTVACSSEVVLGAVTETRATCCPRADGIESFSFSSFTCNTVDPADPSSGKSYYSTLGCTMALGTMAEQGYVSVVATGGAPYTTTVSFATDGGVNAYSVQIAWQASDLIAAKTPSASRSNTTSASSTNNSNGPSETSSLYGTDTGNSSSGLSRSAKIAIGVTVPIVTLALFVALVLLSRYTMAKSRTKHAAERAEVTDTSIAAFMAGGVQEETKQEVVQEYYNKEPQKPVGGISEISSREIHELPGQQADRYS